MSELALQRIREAKEQRLTRLDIGNCGLTKIPEEVFELTWLEELILGGWQTSIKGELNNLKSINPKIKILKSLKILIAGGWDNKWDLSDLTPLTNLTQLQQLYVFNTQVSDLTPLTNLTQLQLLYAFNTQVSDLTPLTNLMQLQKLNVSSTQVSNLRPLTNLMQLQRLAVAETQVSDLTPLTNLQALEDLVVDNTQVSDLTPLTNLHALQDLSLSNTQVSDLMPLTNLQALRDLSFLNTQVSDLTPLTNLHALQILWAINTQVSDLTPLTNLTQLKDLDIQNCKIRRFETLIPFLDKKQFPNLTQLYAHGNPLNDVEDKYLGDEYENGLEKLRKFHKQWLKGERRRLYEAKLILVGEGAVGKTSLKQKLKANKTYMAKPNKTPSTEGILYEPWDLKGCLVEGVKRDVRINIWDFGGQEVDHQTHQFFLSRNSFYVYVSNSRLSDAQSKFDYWLNIIHKLAPESPILLVRNKFDNQEEPFRFQEWLNKYPNQISRKPITIDCTEKDNAGVNEVLAYLKMKISELDSVGKIWPKSYADIREELEKLAADGVNYIEETTYLDICTKHEIDNEDARELSKTLHSIGTILHYQDNKEAEDLKDWVILRPEWVTKAFYRIVRNRDINIAKGKFTKDQLKSIWWKEDGDNKKYPLNIFNVLIDLMKAFDLCFQIGTKKEYIVPQLLNEEENAAAKQRVEGEDVLRFEYHYNDVIPAGMISRFICKQHNNIPKDKAGNYLYWRYGALMEREQTVALIEQPIGDKNIKITVKGTAKRELLAIVRNAFEELHAPLNNLKPDEVLPCNCSVCLKSDKPYPFKYDVIKRRLQKEDVYEMCGISDEDVDRRKLFNDAIDEQFMDVEKIKQLISEGKMDRALSYLNDKNMRTLLGSRLSHLQQQEVLGFIDPNDSRKEMSKLSAHLLNFIQQ
jgi:internalin A